MIHFLKTLKTFAWVRFFDNSSSNLTFTPGEAGKTGGGHFGQSWTTGEKSSQVRVSYLYFLDLEVIKITQRNGFRSEIWRELSKKCKLQFKQVCM